MKKTIGGIIASFLLVAVALPASAALDSACMASAVEKRDNAIISAWNAYSAKVKTALESRRDSVKTAWANTEVGVTSRRAAIRSAWRNFISTVRSARRELKSSRLSAWRTFRNERKSCGASAADEPYNSGNEGEM